LFKRIKRTKYRNRNIIRASKKKVYYLT
jgi:hypothetical protein